MAHIKTNGEKFGPKKSLNALEKISLVDNIYKNKDITEKLDENKDFITKELHKIDSSTICSMSYPMIYRKEFNNSYGFQAEFDYWNVIHIKIDKKEYSMMVWIEGGFFVIAGLTWFDVHTTGLEYYDNYQEVIKIFVELFSEWF